MMEAAKINRKFCLQMAVALLAITALLVYRDKTGVWVALSFAVVFAVVGLLCPQLIEGFRKGWLRFGEVLGNINGVILLSVIYFLVIAPLGIIRRLFGRDAMRTQFKPPVASYWQEPDAGQTSMEEQF